MQMICEKVDPLKPLLPTHTGLFKETLCIGGEKRRILMYIPEATRSWGPAVMLLPDNGVSAEQMIAESGWRILADTDEYMEKPILICLEAAEQGWKLDEVYGDEIGDVAYIQAAYNRMMHRSMFCVAESKCYIMGYGAGATMAEMAVMYNPAVWAAAAALGPVPVQDAYRKAALEAICTDLNGFEDQTGLGLHKGEIPVPFWLVTDTEGRSCTEDTDYWKRALGACEKAYQIAQDTWEYIRVSNTPSPVNQDKTTYRFRLSKAISPQQKSGYLYNRRIFRTFLDSVRRWRSQPGGDLRPTVRMMEALKMEYHYEQIKGWMREWYVYVPETVQNHPEIPVPLVFSFHGYTCSGEIYAGNSCWHEVADQYGFIVIYPSADNGKFKITETNMAVSPDMTALPAWNVFEDPDGPDEIAFFDTMLQKVKNDHAIDMKHIFITGHSMGSLITQLIGMLRSNMLAAIAPCSGVLFWSLDKLFPQREDVLNSPRSDLPIWMFAGEREEWLLPAIPEGDNASANTIRVWWERNEMPGVPPVDFTDGWTVYRGIWHDLCYQKYGRDMIRYTWIENLPHATMPEMSFRIWEDFFSKC